MEVDERPTEQYSDIGGLDKQIQEVSQSSVPHFTLLKSLNYQYMHLVMFHVQNP